MFSPRFRLAQVAVPFLVLLQRVSAESHSIKFVNKCGFGTPTLMYFGKNVLDGDTYTSNGSFSGIAYLQTGGCNVNGENCTLMEMTLINPTCPGCGSSTDISLIPPHVYNVETSFAYYGGCDGAGKTCSNASCTDSAFFKPDDNIVQVACQENDVNLLIAFCAEASQFVTGGATATKDEHSSSTSTPGLSLPAATPTPTPTPTLTPTPTHTDYDCGDDLGTATPSPMPPVNPTGTDDPGCDEPAQTGAHIPTVPAPMQSQPPQPPNTIPGGKGIPDPGCDDPAETGKPTSLPPVPAPAQSQPAQPPTTVSGGTDIPDPGCDEPEETTPPSSVPNPTNTEALSDNSDPGCEEPGETTPSSLPKSSSASVPTPAASPSTDPGTSMGTGEDPCYSDETGTPTPTPTPMPPQPARRFRRHRRANANGAQH